MQPTLDHTKSKRISQNQKRANRPEDQSMSKKNKGPRCPGKLRDMSMHQPLSRPTSLATTWFLSIQKILLLLHFCHQPLSHFGVHNTSDPKSRYNPAHPRDRAHAPISDDLLNATIRTPYWNPRGAIGAVIQIQPKQVQGCAKDLDCSRRDKLRDTSGAGVFPDAVAEVLVEVWSEQWG